MTRTLLTAIFLTLFSQAAWAEAYIIVLLCKPVKFVSINTETMAVERGIKYQWKDEKQGIEKKTIIPTIEDYDFIVFENYINEEDFVVLETRRFLKDQTKLSDWYYEDNVDRNRTARLRLTDPKKLNDRVDRILKIISNEGDYVVTQNANCIYF